MSPTRTSPHTTLLIWAASHEERHMRRYQDICLKNKYSSYDAHMHIYTHVTPETCLRNKHSSYEKWALGEVCLLIHVARLEPGHMSRVSSHDSHDNMRRPNSSHVSSHVSSHDHMSRLMTHTTTNTPHMRSHVSSHDSHDNKHSAYDTPESCLLIWRNMRRHDSSYHCIRRHMRIVCVSCRETRLLLSLPHDSHDNKHSAYDTPESCLLIWGNMRRYDSSYRLIRVSESMGLFCRILSLLWDSFAKETCDLKEPTNRVLEDSILEDRERICVSTHTCSTHLRLETRVVSRVTHTTHYVWLIHICDMAYLYMY